MAISNKNDARIKRKTRIRKKMRLSGKDSRLVVYRSNLHLYAQIVDDKTGSILVSASTLSMSKADSSIRANKSGAELVGKEIARLAKEKNILSVVFDRNGYLYHGRVSAIADAARQDGLEF
ncbi:MAG: 50S ribosomal protein L18 [Desulfovibrionaceae bacterium]